MTELKQHAVKSVHVCIAQKWGMAPFHTLQLQTFTTQIWRLFRH